MHPTTKRYTQFRNSFIFSGCFIPSQGCSEPVAYPRNIGWGAEYNLDGMPVDLRASCMHIFMTRAILT